MQPGKYIFGRTKKLQGFIFGSPKGLLQRTVWSKIENGQEVLNLDISRGEVAVIVENQD